MSAPTLLDHEPRRSFPVLDTMRAVGALLVVVTHCAFNAGAYSRYGVVGPLMARSDVGVGIFFVLSGFLLSRQWLLAAASGGTAPRLRRYVVHRVLRIVPAYVVVAVLALVLLPSNEPFRGLARWSSVLTLSDIYLHERLPYGLTQTWSLTTEIAFYVLLPLLVLVATGRGRRLGHGRMVAFLLTLVAVNVVWLLWLSARIPSHPPRVNEWLPAYLTWFAAGIGLSYVEIAGRGTRVHRWLSALAASPGSCWLLALGLLLVATTPVAGPTLLVPATAAAGLTKNLVYVLVATLVILPGVLGPRGTAYERRMSHRSLRHLGAVSYSLFLVHMPILQLVMWLTGYELFGGHLVPILLLTLALSLVAAELLYRLVELPALRLRSRWDGSSPARRTAQTASSTR